MVIVQVYGVGCSACRRMHEEVQAILADLLPSAQVERVEDVEAIADLGLFSLPALVVNGRPVSTGYRGRGVLERALREVLREQHEPVVMD